MSKQNSDPAEALRQIKARMEAATPGPWQNTYHVTNDKWSGLVADASPTGYAASVRERFDEQSYVDWQPGNEDFIAHARTDIEALVEVAESALAVAKYRGRYELDVDELVVWRARLRLMYEALERLGQRAGEAGE